MGDVGITFKKEKKRMHGEKKGDMYISVIMRVFYCEEVTVNETCL